MSRDRVKLAKLPRRPVPLRQRIAKTWLHTPKWRIRTTILGLIVAIVAGSAVWPSLAAPGHGKQVAQTTTKRVVKPAPKFKHQPQKMTSQPTAVPAQPTSAQRAAQIKQDQALARLAKHATSSQLQALRKAGYGLKPAAAPGVKVSSSPVSKPAASPKVVSAAATVAPNAPSNLHTNWDGIEPGMTEWDVWFTFNGPDTWDEPEAKFYDASNNSLIAWWVLTGVGSAYSPLTGSTDYRSAGVDIDCPYWWLQGWGPVCIFSIDKGLSKDKQYYAVVDFKSQDGTLTGPTATSQIAPPQYIPGIDPSLSGGCSCQYHNNQADPVNTATGVLTETALDASIGGAGIPFKLIRSYRSDSTVSGLVGRGWSLPFESSITTSSSGATLSDPDGTKIIFTKQADGSYAAPVPIRYTLTATASGYTVTDLDLTSRTFDSSGRLTGWADRSGAGYSLARDAAGHISSVTDAAGRVSTFTVDVSTGLLGKVTLPDSTTVQYSYTGGLLTQVTVPDGGATKYTYDSGSRLATIVDPLGNTISQNTYDQTTGRVTQQIDASGGKTTFAWQPASGNVAGSGNSVMTDPAGGVWTDVYSAGVLVGTYTPTNSENTTYDHNLNPVSLNSTVDGTSTETFDSNGNTLTSKDATGGTDTYIYDANNQVTSHTDALGRKTSYAYDSANRLISTTDPLGHTTSRTYTASGQLATVTKPGGGVTTDAYDAQGNLTSVVDPDGGKTSYTYDALGHKLTATDPLGNFTKYTYDAAGRMLTQSDPLGNVTTDTYDAAGNLATTIDAAGNKTTYAYDAAGRQISMTDPLGNVTKTTYDAAGNRATSVDALGNTTTFTYDKSGNELSETDPTGAVRTSVYTAGRVTTQTDFDGNATKTAYDSLGRVLTTTDATGAVTTNTYDAAGQLIGVTDPDGGKTTYTYDAAGRRISQTTPLGETTSWAYDADGNMISGTDPRGNVAGANKASYTTTFIYDKAGRKLSQTDAMSRKTVYSHDAVGRVTTTTDPLGHTTTTVYDADGRPVTVTDGAGNATTKVYDQVGNVIATTDALGDKTTYTFDADHHRLTMTSPRGNVAGASAAAYTTTYAYDANGNQVSMTDPTGAVTTYIYDKDNHTTQVTDPLGNNTAEGFDAVGNLLATVDQIGAQTSYSYDGANRRTATTDDAGNVTTDSYDLAGRHIAHGTPLGKTTWTYDADGRMTAMVDPRGNITGAAATTYTTKYGYDAAGNQTSTIDPLGHTAANAYDAANELTATTDPAAATIGYTYDAAGRILAVTGPDGAVTTYIYDAAGNLTSRTDANGNITGYGYDAGKRLTSTTDPSGAKVTYGYDSDGNKVTKTDARGTTITTTYDARNLPTAVSYSDSTHPVGYSYDPAGHRTGIADATGNRTLTYDPDGRILSITQPGAANPFKYAYNTIGEITSRTYPDGDATSYTWANGVQTGQSDNGSAVSYTYDPAGRLLTAQLPTANGYTETRAYDAVGNLASIATTKTGSTLSAWTLTRDADNRPVGITASRTGQATTTKTYSYDPAGRILTDACTASTGTLDCPAGSLNTTWTYDKVGNRLTQTVGGTYTSYTYNKLDELTSSSTGGTTTNYTYDADRNLTADGTYTYTYDPNNRLTGAAKAGVSAAFTLDDQGNRVTATVGSVTQTMVWDTNNALPQLAYKAGASGTLGDYHYDPTGTPQFVKAGTGTLYLGHDGLGSITDLTDQTGSLQAQYSYTAYGLASTSTGSTAAALAANPFGYTGQLNDPAVAGDQDLRARDYNPATGRFTGRDPIDLRIKDPFVAAFVYAADAPTYQTDPSGQSPIKGPSFCTINGGRWVNGTCDWSVDTGSSNPYPIYIGPRDGRGSYIDCDGRFGNLAYAAYGSKAGQITDDDRGTLSQAHEIVSLWRTIGLYDAADFLAHYLDNSGSTKTFDLRQAYDGDIYSEHFIEVIHSTVATLVKQARQANTSYLGTGYVEFDFPNSGGWLPNWNDVNWFNAIGHAFMLTTVQLQNGQVDVHVRMTNTYQFRDSWGVKCMMSLCVDFAKYERLNAVGLAHDFKYIGDMDIKYNSDGTKDEDEMHDDNMPLWQKAFGWLIS